MKRRKFLAALGLCAIAHTALSGKKEKPVKRCEDIPPAEEMKCADRGGMVTGVWLMDGNGEAVYYPL